jgi:hypothetical protein
VVLLAAAGCWLVGAVRAVRRRAPLLRRRYGGRYVPAEDLAELALNAPRVGNLIADAVHLRDRIAGSRACREQWLAACIDAARPLYGRLPPQSQGVSSGDTQLRSRTPIRIDPRGGEGDDHPRARSGPWRALAPDQIAHEQPGPTRASRRSTDTR